MPMAFAMKMWNWTRMGARVVITPGEMTPASFSHPLLASQRLVSQPAAANEPKPDAPAAAKTDKAANADTALKPAISEASLQLRASVGHNDGAKPVVDRPSAPTLLREQTHTADASRDLPATNAPATMSDAAPSGGSASPVDEAAAPSVSAPSIAAEAPEATKSEAEPSAASTDNKPAETRSLDTASAEIKPAETDAPDRASEKPDTNVKGVTDVRASAPDANKDQARLPDAEKPAASKPDPVATATTPTRTGQIAVLISRKDSKLYVRQNFAPLFDVPVTIASGDRPLGTHVFTAQVDKADANVLHWSVVSLPVRARYAERRDEDERVSSRRKIAVETTTLPVPDSPAEALDRLTLPADAMARITEALSTGGSIIVSDQGIAAGETGEGTDFIVPLR
jgi:hypothetical protein